MSMPRATNALSDFKQSGLGGDKTRCLPHHGSTSLGAFPLMREYDQQNTELCHGCRVRSKAANTREPCNVVEVGLGWIWTQSVYWEQIADVLLYCLL